MRSEAVEIFEIHIMPYRAVLATAKNPTETLDIKAEILKKRWAQSVVHFSTSQKEIITVQKSPHTKTQAERLYNHSRQ